jgi:hypothetical protein
VHEFPSAIPRASQPRVGQRQVGGVQGDDHPEQTTTEFRQVDALAGIRIKDAADHLPRVCLGTVFVPTLVLREL